MGLAEIGFFALVQFPYTWKFVWAPIMDRYTLPFLGHRRGWILLTQVLLLIAISTMGFFKPAMSLWTIAYLATAVAFFSASQDIVLDAYRRELLPDVELGLGNSIHVQAYRLSGLIPGGLALILADHLPWHLVFVIVALFMLVGIVMTLVIDEAIKEPYAAKLAHGVGYRTVPGVHRPFRPWVGAARARVPVPLQARRQHGDGAADAVLSSMSAFREPRSAAIAKLVGTDSGHCWRH